MNKTVKDDLTQNFTKNALTVLNKRYLHGETPADMFHRVASCVAGDSGLKEEFFQMMANLEFLPNSPTLMNAGRPLGQLSACFVLPVGDSMEEIFDSVKHTALIHKSGGGTGFSFSRLRPANDAVMSTAGISSGPLSFMRVFDVATETIKQGGTRRGANMAILRVDHPDILAFIRAKEDQKCFNNFNFSVGITAEFMGAVKAGADYDLINPRDKAAKGTLNAKAVFREICERAWDNGEPGIIFLDRLNRDNPTPHIGEIESTNPCGEQPLLPYESCNLGSINLGKFVNLWDGPEVDWAKLEKAVRLAVRFLDKVIDANKYPMEQIGQMTRANRKIGLGVMGWADMLIMLGIPYNSDEAVELGKKVMKFINDIGHAESRELATTHGAFPNFKGSTYDTGEEGSAIRNATVTTIAPTGTISIIANASSSVEPFFAVAFTRNQADNIMTEVNPLFEAIAKERGFYSEELMRKIADDDHHGSVQGMEEVPADIQRIFVTAHDISPADHIRMQAAFQMHVDNAVSKTVNFPHTATVEDVEEAYLLAYETNCKGVTVYRDGSRDEQVLSTSTKQEVPAPVLAPAPSKPAKRDRPKALRGFTYEIGTGCGPLYITINSDQDGVFEVFTTMGKSGGCASSQCEALGRMVSLAWRSGIQARQVVKQLEGISCHQPNGFGENKVRSCADAVAQAIKSHLNQMEEDLSPEITSQVISHEEVAVLEEMTAMAIPINHRGACPECGGNMTPEAGCSCCKVCGYSECA